MPRVALDQHAPDFTLPDYSENAELLALADEINGVPSPIAQR
jgi:hypothetical protein